MEQLTVLCPSLLSRWPDEIRGKPLSVCVIPPQPLQLHRGRSASSRLIPGGASPASAASSRRKAGSGPEQRCGKQVKVRSKCPVPAQPAVLREQEEEEEEEEEAQGGGCAQHCCPGQLHQVQVCVKVTGSVTAARSVDPVDESSGTSRTSGAGSGVRGINLLLGGLCEIQGHAGGVGSVVLPSARFAQQGAQFPLKFQSVAIKM